VQDQVLDSLVSFASGAAQVSLRNPGASPANVGTVQLRGMLNGGPGRYCVASGNAMNETNAVSAFRAWLGADPVTQISFVLTAPTANTRRGYFRENF